MVISRGHWLSNNCLRIRFNFKQQQKKCRSFCLSPSFLFAPKLLSRTLNWSVPSAVMWVSVRARAAPAAMCRTAVTAVWCAHRGRESRAAGRTICTAGTGWSASTLLEKDCPKAYVSCRYSSKVCGSDENTYGNICQLKAVSWKAQQQGLSAVTNLHKGPCESKGKWFVYSKMNNFINQCLNLCWKFNNWMGIVRLGYYNSIVSGKIIN